jgi:ABC-type multidrug transport system permease subunit
MPTWRPFPQLFLTRLREFYREPEAVFWTYGFPLLLALGLAAAFGNRKPERAQVDVQETSNPAIAEEVAEHLGKNEIAAEVHDVSTCQRRRLTGKTVLFVVPLENGGFRYVYDETQAESRAAFFQVDAALLRWKAGTAATFPTEQDPKPEIGTRYIDFVMPGLIGMNLMGGGLWGVGFVLVDMRVRKLLKRLLATPMKRSHFLLAVIGGRMTLMLPEMSLLLAAGYFGFGVPLRGSLLTLALVILVGATAFSGIGLLLASRTDKTETISGLMNLVMLPMWLLSGTFFSSRRFPDVVQPFIQALPLTQLNNALREVMLEGAGVPEVAWRLAILAAYGVVGFVLALKWFRWQ